MTATHRRRDVAASNVCFQVRATTAFMTDMRGARRHDVAAELCPLSGARDDDLYDRQEGAKRKYFRLGSREQKVRLWRREER
ncbi:hypothetical protein IE4872_CH03103 [Rhizobium gallicum]|uniref:Uncharacterized protein n=1 Tax=Rhizobium gallicum TaxID=56730 RepID=A0A1L5NLD6_9HYPH|nr:hypothetical protein IE4872_CH03103 [Rhizobium gallicum]